MTQRRLALAMVAAAAVTLGLAASGATDPARGRLQLIVQQQCLPLWLTVHRADPCLSVTPGVAGTDSGYAVLHDRKGGAHLLLIATRSITGIESPELREPGAVNYFDAAWQARAALSAYLGHPPARESVGLALNSRRARSQDQLHIHIECLGPGIFTALKENAHRLPPAWTPWVLDGRNYQVLRLPGAELGQRNPVALLAASLPPGPAELGEFTMLVAGVEYPEGPGFAVLASDTGPGAERLLDATCAVDDGRAAQ